MTPKYIMFISRDKLYLILGSFRALVSPVQGVSEEEFRATLSVAS